MGTKGQAISEITMKQLGAAYADTGSLPKTAERVKVSISTVYKYRSEIEALAAEVVRGRQATARAVSSDILLSGQRDRIRRAIGNAGFFPTVDGLIEATIRPGESPSLDGIVAILWSMQKQGEVTFVEGTSPSARSHSGAQHGVIKIEATDLLYSRLGWARPDRRKGWPPFVPASQTTSPVGVDRTKPSAHGLVAQGGEIERRMVVDRPIPEAAVVTPDEGATYPVGVDMTDHHNHDEVAVVVSPYVSPSLIPGNEPPVYVGSFPILTGLRAQQDARGEAERRADVYLQAAAVVESVNPDEANRMQGLAEAEVARFRLTPIEDEYLRFAASLACDDCGAVGGHNPDVEH